MHQHQAKKYAAASMKIEIQLHSKKWMKWQKTANKN